MSTATSPGKAPRPDGKPPVVLIAGPTASGKSDLAVRLALMLGEWGRRGVVINADSAQVYADLQILSARPTRAEMQGVEHRLFGAWDGARACSAADWAAAARKEMEGLHAAGAVPILCGGTGLYLRTLLYGIAPIPEIDDQVRETVRALDTRDAYEALCREDPGRAAQLDASDRQRIKRALEVVRSTGKGMLEWQADLSGGIEEAVALHPLILLPERDWLYQRCDLRFERMIDAGAVSEVEALLARGLDPTLPVMRAIGVGEIAAWLKGELSRDEAIAAGQLATRQYAKRQYTWFRNQPPERWVRAESKNCEPEVYFERLFRL